MVGTNFENEPVGSEMRRKKYDVPADVFCKTWQELSSAEAVAEKLQMPKPIVLARASFYRKHGVKLKNMPRNKSRLDVEGLNEMLDAIVSDGRPESFGDTLINIEAIDDETTKGKRKKK